MKAVNQWSKWVGRVAAPEVWALGALILFAVSLHGGAPEGPQMQLTFATCAPGAVFHAGAPLEAKLDRMTEEIDTRTERVWRRLEFKMRALEQRLAKSPGACTTREMRASMFEE